jgi:hypothetical protein
MHDPKALALFQEIHKKTMSGKLAWQPTAEPNKFVAPMLGKYTLTLLPYSSIDEWGVPQGPPSVILADERENSIVEMNIGVDGIERDELQSLLVFARRIALNADVKIDELLQELRKDDDIPF